MSKTSKQATQPTNKNGIQPLWIVGVVILVLALVGGVIFLSGGDSEDTNDTAATTNDTSETTNNTDDAAANDSASSVEMTGNTTPQNISPNDYNAQFSSGDHFLLDVRTTEEFESGHIEGAANINVQVLSNQLDEVPRDQPIVVYCRSGNRSTQASSILAQAGFTDVYNLGGIIEWQNAGYTLVQ